MRIALKSALMLVTRVINAINPRLDLHLQRTALISYKLSLALDLPAPQQKTIFLAALLHDIGVLGDKRRIDSLNAIDNLYDPHQIRGVQMLAGLDTFTPISPIIGDHHFSPSRKGNLEQHIVYFADCFERLLLRKASLPRTNKVLSSPALSLTIATSILHFAIDYANWRSTLPSGAICKQSIFSGCWRSSGRLMTYILTSMV